MKNNYILDKHVKGRTAENLAEIYFLNKGYHVFSNISQQGCIDMVVINKDNKVIKIDVKSICRRKRDNHKINRSRTPLQKLLDVQILYVDTEKKECYFYREHENHLKRRTDTDKI